VDIKDATQTRNSVSDAGNCRGLGDHFQRARVGFGPGLIPAAAVRLGGQQPGVAAENAAPVRAAARETGAAPLPPASWPRV